MVIKTLSSLNPFSDYGQVIRGNRFAGRISEIEYIRNRVLGSSFGNLAIIGMPRIGKSSLAWNALMAIKDDQIQMKNLVMTIYVGSIDSSQNFFKQLVVTVLDELEEISFVEIGHIQDKMAAIYEEIKGHLVDKFELDLKIDKFFKLLNRCGFRATYVLDEFDSVSKFFSASDFQKLRKLASFDECKICLVTVSRRTIQEIEPENGAISNFYGVFSELRLGLFNSEDFNSYWERVKAFGIEFSESYVRNLEYLVGGHPFLIDMYNFEAFNILSNNKNLISESLSDKIESDLRLNLYNNFEKILSLLKEEGLYTKALQLVLGPVYDVSPIEEEKLLKYQFLRLVSTSEKYRIIRRDLGIRKQDSSYSYVCFSDFFTELFVLKLNDVDYWPIWNQTEKMVRELIKSYLLTAFGDNWEIAYLKKHEKSDGKIKSIQRLDEVRTYSKNRFGSLASSHLVDYTFPRDMYDLFISSDWVWFEKVFGDSKNEWARRFNTLAEVRNPIAHNNSEFIARDDLQSAKKYCELIVARISKWKEVNNLDN